MIEERGRAWLLVAGAMLAHAIAFGMIVYSFTVFVPEILDEFGTGRGAVAWVVSLATALMLAAGGVAGTLTDRFGPRRVMIAGAILAAAGLWLATLAHNVWHLVASYGLVSGTGASMTFVPAIAAVGRVFHRRRGLALGLAAAGTGIGTLVLAPLATALVDAGGWRSALRVLSAIALGALIVASVLMPARAPQYEQSLADAVDMKRNRSFRLLVLGSLFGAFGYWAPFVFIAPYAQDQGLSATAAAGVVALMGVANTLGRVVMGGLADRIGRLRVLQSGNVVMVAAILVWPAATSRLALTVFAVVYALAAGAFIAVLPALAGDYFGAERLGSATGLLFSAAALGTLLCAPVTGMIVDASGTWILGTSLDAGMLALGAIPLFMLHDPRVVAPVPLGR